MTEKRANTPAKPVLYLIRVLGIEPDEMIAVAWSFIYFFCILSAYYMLRSVRDAMAIVSGVQNIPWLFTGTFVLMLLATPVFGWITSKYPRRVFLPWIYYFFVANILIFYAVFTYAQNNELSEIWIGRAFFIWLSVFNLFVVSVFWSFMADIYSKKQSRRLFGVITAGGSAGALIGPIVTSIVVVQIGFRNMLPLSALLLLFAVFCVYRLRGWVRQQQPDPGNESASSTVVGEKVIGGSAWAGVKFVLTKKYFSAIAVALVCATFLGGATYMYMAEMVSVTFEGTDKRTQVFAIMDAMINAMSFIGQLLIVKHSVRKLGIGGTLALLPIVSVIGFTLLAVNPVFLVIAGLQVLRRSITFGLTKPTSDMLYSVVSPEAKYKAKNFIETAIYRGGDVISTWTIRFISGIGLSGVALVCVPIALIWTWLAIWIGGEYKRRDAASSGSAAA
ncbi:MAG: MFS transporter [Gammaproteobacteria bacterium]|nr:MAG: MFS transporter [Gammaproteobacteria bacterium]